PDAAGGDGVRRPRAAAHPHGSGGPSPPHVRGVPTVTSHFVYLALRSRAAGMLSRTSREPFGGDPPPPPTSHFALELWESILVLRENRSQAAHEQAGTAALAPPAHERLRAVHHPRTFGGPLAGSHPRRRRDPHDGRRPSPRPHGGHLARPDRGL